jgi:hypothetical protein
VFSAISHFGTSASNVPASPRPTTESTGARQLTQIADSASTPLPMAAPSGGQGKAREGDRETNRDGGENLVLAPEAHQKRLRTLISELSRRDEFVGQKAAILRVRRRRRHLEGGEANRYVTERGGYEQDDNQTIAKHVSSSSSDKLRP